MIDILGHIFIIALFWFILYWILGGVVFGAIAIIKVVKLRRARFSCLFTLLSLGAAFGASYFGAQQARGSIDVCLAEQGGDFFGELASIVACGILEQMLSGVIWFAILVAVGFLAFILSRAENQSWMDSDHGLEEQYDILEL